MFIYSFISVIPAFVVVLLFVLQYLLPRRKTVKVGWSRMVNNGLLFLINTFIFRLLVPLSLVAVVAWSEREGFGFFNNVLVNKWVSLWACFVVLDFAIYWQHVATHKLDFLWRLHKVHHADHDMDVTTAIRFHPFELLLSFFYKSMVVILLGAPVEAVIVFELLLFIGPAFNHSNLALPIWMDTMLRWVIATPDTHRTHHSIYKKEQDTNYGFFLIWWDKIFGTYTQEPVDGHTNMQIGLAEYQILPEKQEESVAQILLMPFK